MSGDPAVPPSGERVDAPVAPFPRPGLHHGGPLLGPEFGVASGAAFAKTHQHEHNPFVCQVYERGHG